MPRMQHAGYDSGGSYGKVLLLLLLSENVTDITGLRFRSLYLYFIPAHTSYDLAHGVAVHERKSFDGKRRRDS